MKTKFKNRSGFTLIELMIVFVIIIVLAGMVLRLMNLSGVKNAEAKTRENLERVAQALEEFRATYGRYPPVDYYPEFGQPLRYEYANTNMMSTAVQETLRQRSQTENIWNSDGSGRVFTFGLLSYFFPRFNSHASSSPASFIGSNNSAPQASDEYNASKAINQWKNYNERSANMTIGDIVQNIESSRRILPFLGASLTPDGFVASYGIVHHWATGELTVPGNDGLTYRNMYLTIWDGWDRDLHYESRPPYDSYKLWSAGPDGISGTSDDMTLGQE